MLNLKVAKCWVKSAEYKFIQLSWKIYFKTAEFKSAEQKFIQLSLIHI